MKERMVRETEHGQEQNHEEYQAGKEWNRSRSHSKIWEGREQKK